MPAPKLTRRLFWAAEVLLLAGTRRRGRVAVDAPRNGSRSRWSRCCWRSRFVGEWLSIETPAGQLSAATGRVVLAMGLLGPVPAVAFGVAAMIMTSAARRLAAQLNG